MFLADVVSATGRMRTNAGRRVHGNNIDDMFAKASIFVVCAPLVLTVELTTYSIFGLIGPGSGSGLFSMAGMRLGLGWRS